MNNVEEQVVQEPVKPNDIRIRQSFKDHLTTVQKIITFQADMNSGVIDIPTRSVSNNCDYCDFKRVCKTSLKGEDTEAMIQHGFTANDYGYEDL
jgi:hypothetical protein